MWHSGICIFLSGMSNLALLSSARAPADCRFGRDDTADEHGNDGVGGTLGIGFSGNSNTHMPKSRPAGSNWTDLEGLQLAAVVSFPATLPGAAHPP